MKTGISNACNTLRANSDTPYLCSHINETTGIKLNIKGLSGLEICCMVTVFALSPTATPVGADRLSTF